MTDIIETTITTEIAEYNATAAALADLRSKYEKVLFPVETPKGMKDALAARKELRDIRFGLEKMRKEIKEPVLRRCQLIDSEAKEITARLTALEDPIDKQIKAEKLERERVERERVAAIRTKIDFIKRLPFDSANDSAEDIATTIDELEPLQIDDSYAEFAAEAQAAKEGALIALQTLHVTTKAREEEDARLKAEREELDRQRAELERMRAELEAAKAPEPVAEPTTPAEPVAQYSDIVSDGGLDPRNNPEPVFQLAAQEDTSEPESAPMEDANDLVSEFAGYTAMQFIALADKVAALGYESFAEGLRKDGQVIAEGHYNEQIKVADWKALADADKRMALAAHACVSVLEGDDEFGTSSLRQFNQKKAA